jgi:hypothetical protein
MGVNTGLDAAQCITGVRPWISVFFAFFLGSMNVSFGNQRLALLIPSTVGVVHKIVQGSMG